jgi:MFS family permease
MLPFLSAYPVKETTAQSAARGALPWRTLILALVAIFLFQAGNMALAAYMIGLGRAFGLTTDFITTTLGAASWIGAVGSILVIVAGTRMGRFWPVLFAFVPTLLGNAAFHLSASPQVFFFANVGTAITWAFIMPYLLGICASLDDTGQMAAFAGFSSHMGLATGPLLGGLLLAAPDYRLLINAAVAVLCISAVAALVPAFQLDRRSCPEPQTLAETTP